MFNFFTKKQKNQLNSNAEENQKLVNQMWQENYNNALNNTVTQNFTAEQYNNQAKANGEQDWNNAYRRDILWIEKEPETEYERKQRLYNEEKARKEAEYQKRVAENPDSALPSTQPQTTPNNIPEVKDDPRVKVLENYGQIKSTTEPEKAETTQNLQTTTTETTKNTGIIETTAGNVDYSTWDVEWWKKRWSSKEELENAVEKKYWTVANYDENWNLNAVINWEKFQWSLDSNWNPVKTSLWKADQGDLTRNQVFQMVQNWNTTEEINGYIYKNNLQNDPQVQNQLKQKYIDDYEKPILQKYKNLSLEDLHKAVLNGEILPWSDVFNKLPQAQAYNQYQKSFAIIDARKDRDFSQINSSIDIDKIIEKRISKFFDTAWVEDVAERWRNDSEIKQYRADIYERQKNIASLQWEMKNIEKEVRSRMWWAPESRVQAEIARQAENILNSISTETALMNVSLWMIWDRKSDFEVEMKMLWYKDWLKKEQYMAWLNEYKYETTRMDDFKKLELQYKNQELAFNRQHQAQKEIMELQQKYKGWTYQVWVDGSLNYIVNWVAQKVKFDDWKVLFTRSTDDMSISTKLNDDWTFSVYSVSKDGKNVHIQHYDMEGNLIAWMPNKIAEALSKVWVDGKQCAEWVNDYLNLLWVKGNYVPSDWEGKKSLINSEGPVIGWLAIWNPAQIWSENHKYWHVWIIESVSQDWQYVYISDWNADWVSEKFTRNRKVAISDIMKTWWFNRPPVNIKKWQWDFNSIVWNTDLRNSEWKNKYPNEASFKNNNTAWITWNSNFENPKPWTTAYILQKNGINFHKWTERPSSEWWYYVAFDNVEDWVKAHYLMLKNSTQTVRDRLKSWVWIWNVDAYAKEVFAWSWLDLKLLDKPLNTLSDSELTPLLKSQIKRESSWMYRYLEQNNWLQNYQAVSSWTSKRKTTSSSTSTNSSSSSNSDSWVSENARTWVEAIQKWKQTLENVFSTLWNSKEMAALKTEIQKQLLAYTPENQKLNEESAERESKMLTTLNWLLDDKNAGTRESATWKINWSWSNWWAWDRDDYLAEMNFLLDNQTLTALSNAKNNWVTFGSLSWNELETVHKSASALNWLAIRDKDWKITWFNWSEERFVELLKEIRKAYQKAYSKKSWKTLDNWDY